MFLEYTDTGEGMGLQNSKTKELSGGQVHTALSCPREVSPLPLLTHCLKTEDETVFSSTHKVGFAE